MTALAFILSLCTISESLAGDAINCKTGQQSCGTNCCWSVEGTTLKITGGKDGTIGTMNNYFGKNSAEHVNRPWENEIFTKIDIDGVKNIGQKAFYGFSDVSQTNMGDMVESIGWGAYVGTRLNSLVLPDSLKIVDNYAFSEVPIEYLSISDSINYIGAGAFKSTNINSLVLPDSINTIGVHAFDSKEDVLEIVCKGNKNSCSKLAQLLKEYRKYDKDLKENVLSPLFFSSYAKEFNCSSTNYFWNGAECLREPDVTKRKCCSSCKDMGGYCNRIRYTPAEAAEVLTDDNNNSVTITFKM